MEVDIAACAGSEAVAGLMWESSSLEEHLGMDVSVE